MQNWFVVVPVCTILVLIAVIATSTHSEETMKIGVLTPLTGSASIYGEAVQHGLELRAQQYSRNKNIRLIFEDTRCSGSTATRAARKLLNVNDVQYIIGAVCSPATLATTPLTAKKNVIQLSPVSSAPSITDTHAFRLYPSDVFQAQQAVKMMEKQGHERIAILYLENDYGAALKDHFTELWNSTVVTQQALPKDSDDYRTQVAKALRKKPDALYVIGLVDETARVMKHLHKRNNTPPVVGTESLRDKSLFDLARVSSVDGLRFPTAKSYDGKKAKQFRQRYNERFGEQPPLYADYGYDALSVLIKAVENTDGSYDEVRKYLVQENFSGATGKIDFDRNGDVIRSYQIMEIRNGSFIPIN